MTSNAITNDKNIFHCKKVGKVKDTLMEKNCSKDFSTWERAENTAETLFGNIWNTDRKK